MTESRIVTIFGGSGFLGRHLATALAREGYRVNIASRNPDKALFVKTAGMVGQVNLIPCSITSAQGIAPALVGADIAINLVGILYQKGRQRFAAVHARGAELIAQEAKKAGVQHFIHVSALGADKAAHSNYARTKLNGEKAVLNAFPNATILRPSIIFGPEDQFFNRFARYASLGPVMPLIGGGKTKFQPVFVGDVVEAILKILKRPPEATSQVYELGGPKVYSFKELMEFVLKTTNRKRPMASIPFPVAKLMAFPNQVLPRPPLTVDQVTLLEYDNVVSPQTNHTFKSLGITPRKVEDIVPEYLERYKRA